MPRTTPDLTPRHALPRARAVLGLLSVCAALLALGGCDPTSAPGASTTAAKPASQPASWTHQGDPAPYAVTLSGAWQRVPVETFHNEFAALTARGPASCALMVIPQKLPALDDGSPGTLDAFARAGESIMRAQVPSFDLSRRGSIIVGGEPARQVVARGESAGQPVVYVVTYAQRGAWGVQIIAWALDADAATLTREVDALLKTWRFTDADASPAAAPKPS